MSGPGAGGRRLAVVAPAKVNLGLRVVGRRPDGYHEIESLFVPLDLADTVTLEEGGGAARGEPQLILHGEARGVPADGSNLALRAARAFLESAGLRVGLRIELEKRIPAAAGLGGGSSDAGAVLRGLSALHPGRLDAKALAELALRLGADVPFFLDPRPALVRGIGERIESVAGLPALCLVLLHPGLGLATARVYGGFDALRSALTPPDPGYTLRALSALQGPDGNARNISRRGESSRDAGVRPDAAARVRAGAPDETSRLERPRAAQALGELLANDLEAAATRLCPPIARLRRTLEAAGARAVGMSGSGPSVFGVFGDEAEAQAALARCELPGSAWGRVLRTLASSG